MLSPFDAHHDGSTLYLPESPELGARVPVRVRVPHGPDGRPQADRVLLRSVRDGEPLLQPAVQESVDPGGAWWTAPLHVHNPLTSYRFLLARGRTLVGWLNGEGVHRRDVTDAGDFRVSTLHRGPSWVADQIGYQVFPDRFARTETGIEPPSWAVPEPWDAPVVHRGRDASRQLYGGTLDGVASRLDHLLGLGATLLYLTPVFPARSSHRYDATAFDHVDPLLGGDAALAGLVDACRQRGLRLLGDLTTNHTGSGHAWFERALSEPASVERRFYLFDGDDYASWLDHPSLPKLNHSSEALARRLYAGSDSVAARWLRRGLDGWRVDVANMTGRHGTQDLAHHVAHQLRRTIADVRGDEGWLLAEHGHDATGDLAGDGWHGTMDYAGFTRPVWSWLSAGAAPSGLDYIGLPIDVPTVSAKATVAAMRQAHAAMPWQSLAASTVHLDSHDLARFRSVTGGGTSGWIDSQGAGRARHLAGLALQMTMPGVPVVYMGDEIGLTGVDGEHSRTPFPWTRRDEWDGQTLAAYRDWIALRRRHVALRHGGLRWLHASGDSMTYLREHPDETLLVHVTRASTAPTVLPVAALGGRRELVPVVGAACRWEGERVVLPGDGPGATVLACL